MPISIKIDAADASHEESETLARLARSTFRSRFHLSNSDRAYALNKGEAILSVHAKGFISKRLAPAFSADDGKQTPMKGHPVFTAQHACACCCRGCLAKWHHIPAGRPLTNEEIERIVSLILAWIRCELAQEPKKQKPSPQGELF